MQGEASPGTKGETGAQRDWGPKCFILVILCHGGREGHRRCWLVREAQRPSAQVLPSSPTHPCGCQPLCSPNCANLAVLEPGPQRARSCPCQAPNCPLRETWPPTTQALEPMNHGVHVLRATGSWQCPKRGIGRAEGTPVARICTKTGGATSFHKEKTQNIF